MLSGPAGPVLYLDTSVVSAYHDDRTPERRQQTRDFWTRMNLGQARISTLVVEEIGRVAGTARRRELLDLVAGFEVLGEPEEARVLAREFVAEGIFPERYEDDARHAAIASVAGVEILVSWNFAHLVKVRTRRAVNLVNALKGYAPIEIVAPPEV